ncbi:MAG: hypothetical protein JSV12_00150 [Candidatus Bathyarchaeota archaeon]|nr:MAG: hypothetical protein JSV12_00150 [Candidatus Bathyarchaeota archaeon]
METVDVNLPVDRVYSLLLKYFSRERYIKVKRSEKPLVIEVAVGSLFLSNPYDVKLELLAENEKTSMELNFDFAKTYAIGFIGLPLGLAIVGYILVALGLLAEPAVIISGAVAGILTLVIGASRTADKAKKAS